jgi:hypothetical protein
MTSTEEFKLTRIRLVPRSWPIEWTPEVLEKGRWAL